MTEPLIFEKSRKGRRGFSLPEIRASESEILSGIPPELLRVDPPHLPEVSENEVVRHYVRLSQKNFAVDVGFYPLGSCTMKYNPKVNEKVPSMDGFANIHPLEEDHQVAGALELIWQLEQYLCALFGFSAFTFQPAAGAHGELTALLMIKKYHAKEDDHKRTKMIVPDSAHGTNPASVSFVGYETVVVPSDSRGGVDLDKLSEKLDDRVAGLMLTNPNTLGLFDENILEVARRIHSVGGLLYYDGANANATLGRVRPADLGFDIAHFNLHKTFSTPHGGGGPGAGPVGVVDRLIPFLPTPRVVREGDQYIWKDFPNPPSIGRVHGFHGNFGMLVRAYTYIRSLGREGLKEVSELAVLNANYLLHRLKDHFEVMYPRACQHEFVISTRKYKKEFGVSALDFAKRLLDYGFHAPTVYFPLNVPEALMIEPTETESKETLDAFADAMIAIAKEAKEKPELVKGAPYTTPVRRLDEVGAARNPDICYVRINNHTSPRELAAA